MQTLPNQESLLQNQVFLAAQYSSTYLRFPYRKRGEGAERPHTLMLAPMRVAPIAEPFVRDATLYQRPISRLTAFSC